MLRDLLSINETIDFDDYEIYEELGEGPISKVFRGVNRKTRQEVSLKILKEDQKKIHRYTKTITTIKLLNLPGFAKIIGYQLFLRNSKLPDFLRDLFHDFYHEENEFYLIIAEEYMKNGSLSLYLNQEPHALSPTIRSKIIYGVASTMKCLHEHRIVYRDLKPYNILLDDNFEPKISFCTLILKLKENDEEEELEDGVGTLKYGT